MLQVAEHWGVASCSPRKRLSGCSTCRILSPSCISTFFARFHPLCLKSAVASWHTGAKRKALYATTNSFFFHAADPQHVEAIPGNARQILTFSQTIFVQTRPGCRRFRWLCLNCDDLGFRSVEQLRADCSIPSTQWCHPVTSRSCC